MSYKIDEVLSMLDEVLMRLDRLESVLANRETVTFTEERPKLSIVDKTPDNTVVLFPDDK
jgi:hypothetical protein